MIRLGPSFVKSFMRGAVVATLGALTACGNLTLDSSSNSGFSPGASYDVHGSGDAGNADAYASGPTGGLTTNDAAPAPTLFGSPLCNVSWTSQGTHLCKPDDGTCSPNSAAPVLTDAGYLDGGETPYACRVVEKNGTVVQACMVAGTGGDGDQCQTAADCAAGFDCVGTPGQCRHYCCDGNVSCSGDEFCDIEKTADTSGLSLPICRPATPCKLLTSNACKSGDTCAIVRDDGSTSCVAVGEAKAGDNCDSEHCADGLTCLGAVGSRQCFKLCMVSASDCPSGQTCKGSAQLFTDPSYGLCQ